MRLWEWMGVKPMGKRGKEQNPDLFHLPGK